MLLKSSFVRNKSVKSTVKPVVVHLTHRHAQQIAKSATLVKILRYTKFARWVAQPTKQQHKRHRGPGYLFSPPRHDRLKELYQTKFLHYFKPKPRSPENTRPLYLYPRRVHLHPARLSRIEQTPLADVFRVARRCFLYAQPTSLIQIAQMSNYTLARTSLTAVALHQLPVVFLSSTYLATTLP